jgi:hypothetical protein
MGRMATTLKDVLLIARFRELVEQATQPNITDCRNMLELVERLSREIYQGRITVEAARILEPSFFHISTVLNQIVGGFEALEIYFYSSSNTNGSIEWFARRHNQDRGPFPNLTEAVQAIVEAGWCQQPAGFPNCVSDHDSERLNQFIHYRVEPSQSL